MNHQESGTANLHQLTSIPGPLLPKPTLWFHLSWGELIIMTLIMVVLNLPLHSFQLSLTLNQFQIHTPLQLNQFMMIKWIISWNYYIQNMIKIFWMLTAICFKLEWWSPLLQNFIQYLLYCFVTMEEHFLVTNFKSHFSMFVPTKATVKLANGNTGHVQEIGIF